MSEGRSSSSNQRLPAPQAGGRGFGDPPGFIGPLRVAVATVLGWVALGFQCWRTFPFVADDTLISLRYSRRVLEGHGLTWTDGEWVEGYSNLLMVLGAAFFGLFGLDLLTAARVVGILGAAGAVVAVAIAGARHGAGPAIAGAVMLGASPGLGVWVVGGLEQPLLAGLLAGGWALALWSDGHERGDQLRWAAGVFLALACWTRPDSPLFVVVASAWGLSFGWRGALALAAPGAAAYGAQMAFRLVYYGDYVPNTAYAKLALTWHRVETGVEYVWEGGWPMGVLLLAALVGTVRADNRVRGLLVPSIVVWVVYVAFLGGDIFPARRHLVPVLPALALLAGQAFRDTPRLAWLGALGLAAGHACFDDTFDNAYRRGRLERWEWQCSTIAGAVGSAFREADALLATNTAGCWPYFSELDSIDMLGLNDAHIARNPTPLLGQGWLGHELGDGVYVLNREPDLVVLGPWGGAAKPGFYGDRQLLAQPRFKEDYRLVRFESAGQSALVWVWRESPRIGGERTEKAILLPPWRFGKQGPGVVTVLPRQGAPFTRFTKGARSTEAVKVPAGSWMVEVEGEGPAIIAVAGGRALDARSIHMEKPGTMRITLIAEDGPLKVREVRLVPVDEGP